MSLRKGNGVFTVGDFIVFRNDGPLPDKVTNFYTVMTAGQDQILGIVKWFGRWRKYCFFPYISTVYEETCLRDIADFCVQETKAHRVKRKAEKQQ